MSSNIISLLTLLFFEFRHSLFTLKAAYICDCLLESNMLLLNLLIYCRYYLYVELADLWEQCFVITMYIFVSVEIFYLLVSCVFLFKPKTFKVTHKMDVPASKFSIPSTNLMTLITQGYLSTEH